MPNFLVTLTYNVSDAVDADAAAEQFRAWLTNWRIGSPLVVNVREVPLNDDQDFTEVEL